MKSSSLYHTTMLLAAPALLGLGTAAQAQLFSDDFGDATKYTIAGDSDPATVEDVRFNFNYGSFDIFGDGFITGGLAEAPNSVGGAATTGLFISANNNSLSATSLVAAVFANGVNVGAGTANEDYVLRFDSYQSVSTGIDGDAPPRATNYQFAGINYDITPASPGDRGPMPLNPVSSLAANNESGTSGQAIYMTGEQGAFDDYEVLIGNRVVEDRNEGFTGLATAHIQQGFIDAGFSDADYVTPITNSQGDDGFASPTVGNEAAFDNTDLTTIDATARQYWREQFPTETGAPEYDATGANENPKEFLRGGTPSNQWTSHEIYSVDGIWTYVIDGTMVLQVDPTLAGDGTQSVSTNGTFALGFLDGFSSFNDTPEGSNFVIYDNIVLDTATALDVPDMTQFLIDNGYIPNPVVALVGDYNADGSVDSADYTIWADNFSSTVNLAADGNGDGVVDSADYTLWADNFGNSAALSSGAFPIPEPSAGLILAGLGLIAARRRRQA